MTLEHDAGGEVRAGLLVEHLQEIKRPREALAVLIDSFRQRADAKGQERRVPARRHLQHEAASFGELVRVPLRASIATAAVVMVTARLPPHVSGGPGGSASKRSRARSMAFN